MINLKNITLRRGVKVILQDASVTINPGEKVGLVGRNGAGKSTVFALLTGKLHEDNGEFSIPPHWRMAQVAQDMPETEDAATDFVVDGDLVLAAARAEVAAAESPENADDYERMAHAYTALHDAGEHDAPARAQALLMGLGFTSAQLMLPVNSFSGGWRMRLQLARALMCPSDLLLLDEPTNHLDLDALVWLESWLRKYEGTVLVISHDREFLDAVTQVTVHIDAQKLVRYGGHYSRFEDMRAEQLEQQQAAYSRQQDKIAHLQKFIARFKAKASKAKQAQSRVKALDRMERIAPLLNEADFQFNFLEPVNIPNPMLALSGVDVGYPAADDVEGAQAKVIVHNIQRSVQAGERIGILGANGQGKSTLVKTIARTLAPVQGTVTEGKGLSIGYFAQQELDVLRPDESPLQHMTRMARELAQSGGGSRNDREQDLRGFLGSFNFTGDMVHQSVGSMSGGEKARLVLAMLVWQRPNLLLLDEPTNHLDLATREALGMALNSFEGTVMLVSHDRALLRSVCDEFWLVAQGAVKPFDGDLDDYQQYLLDEAKRQREALKAAQQASRPAPEPKESKPATPAPTGPSPEQVRKWKKELSTTEQQMSKAQTDIAALELRFTENLSADELAQAGKRHKELQQQLAALEEQWLHLTESIGE